MPVFCEQLSRFLPYFAGRCFVVVFRLIVFGEIVRPLPQTGNGTAMPKAILFTMPVKRLRLLFIFCSFAGLNVGLIFGCMASAATAPPDTGAYKYAVVRSLAGQFLTYDTRFQGYVPYTEVLEGNPSALSFWLNCRQDRYSLRLKTTPGLCLFADRKLFYACWCPLLRLWTACTASEFL